MDLASSRLPLFGRREVKALALSTRRDCGQRASSEGHSNQGLPASGRDPFQNWCTWHIRWRLSQRMKTFVLGCGLVYTLEHWIRAYRATASTMVWEEGASVLRKLVSPPRSNASIQRWVHRSVTSLRKCMQCFHHRRKHYILLMEVLRMKGYGPCTLNYQ